MENREPECSPADVSLNGFERIFVQVAEANIHEQNSADTTNHEHVHSFNVESFELVTMAEASRRLNMPYPTLRRHVLSGKIPSARGPDGKAMVKLTAGEHSSSTASASVNTDEQTIVVGEFSLTIQRVLDQLEAERERSLALSAKLEAASHRNGYLEAQVESHKEQIRLLTDSQHKAGWWRRFCSWALGN